MEKKQQKIKQEIFKISKKHNDILVLLSDMNLNVYIKRYVEDYTEHIKHLKEILDSYTKNGSGNYDRLKYLIIDAKNYYRKLNRLVKCRYNESEIK